MASACCFLSLFSLVLALCAAEKCNDDSGEVTLTEDIFGYINRTVPVKRYTWTNKNNVTAQVITYGGRIISIKVPDKHGNIEDIVLGFDHLEGYLGDNPYFGAILGRVANRIIDAKFDLNGVQYNLTSNENGNTLHGGTKGFDRVVWEPYVHGTELTLSYISEDGEDGFPGSVETQVTYQLTADSQLIFKVYALTTKPTPINIANHAYYNLAGQNAGPKGIYQHTVSINADKYTVTTSGGAPTGEIDCVGGTDFDFRIQQHLGPLIKTRGGYDNNYCVNVEQKGKMMFIARVEHPESGRVLEVYSNQPGVQLYTGNNLPQKSVIIGKGGSKYVQYGAVCLETQDYPDAVHHKNFPSSILNPGQLYLRSSSFKFSTKQ